MNNYCGTKANDIKPPCVSNSSWNCNSNLDENRQGIRMIRPSISINAFSAFWNSDKYDSDANGLLCPGGGVVPHNILQWSDDDDSYLLEDFSISAPSMDFIITAP